MASADAADDRGVAGATVVAGTFVAGVVVTVVAGVVVSLDAVAVVALAADVVGPCAPARSVGKRVVAIMAKAPNVGTVCPTRRTPKIRFMGAPFSEISNAEIRKVDMDFGRTRIAGKNESGVVT